MKNILKKRLLEIQEKKEQSNANDVLEELIIRSRLEYIDSTVSQMDDEIRKLVTDLWVNKYSKTKTARRNKVSETGIYCKVEKELRKVL